MGHPVAELWAAGPVDANHRATEAGRLAAGALREKETVEELREAPDLHYDFQRPADCRVRLVMRAAVPGRPVRASARKGVRHEQAPLVVFAGAEVHRDPPAEVVAEPESAEHFGSG